MMTHEARNMLYRVEMWCSREWGAALAVEQNLSANEFDPFGTRAWFAALRIVDDLRCGREIPRRFRKGE